MIRPDYREIYHYGIPRKSGRYPWGSGERPYQSREERRLNRKENRQKKKLIRKFNKQSTREEFYKVQDLTYGSDVLSDKRIEKYKNKLNTTLGELKEHGIGLDDIKVKSVNKVFNYGGQNWFWTGNKYYINDKNDK